MNSNSAPPSQVPLEDGVGLKSPWTDAGGERRSVDRSDQDCFAQHLGGDSHGPSTAHSSAKGGGKHSSNYSVREKVLTEEASRSHLQKGESSKKMEI